MVIDEMKDVQKELDTRNIQIDRVGVTRVSYPIIALDHENRTQSTIASVSMSVMLPREYRGTHMSRFIETLEEYHGRVSPSNLEAITRRLCETPRRATYALSSRTTSAKKLLCQGSRASASATSPFRLATGRANLST